MKMAEMFIWALVVAMLVVIVAKGETTNGPTSLCSGAFSSGSWAGATNKQSEYVITSGTATWNSVVSPRVYFSPNYGEGDCTSNLVVEIGKAKSNIYVSAYQFTSQDISGALVKAKKRKVDVLMIVDHSAMDAKNSKVWSCASNGVLVVVDKKHNIFHNKMMVIDKQTVITGSFNFTANAEFHNAENMWVIADTNAAMMCVSNWMTHFSHSVPLK